MKRRTLSLLLEEFTNWFWDPLSKFEVCLFHTLQWISQSSFLLVKPVFDWCAYAWLLEWIADYFRAHVTWQWWLLRFRITNPSKKSWKNSSFYEGHYSGGNFKYIFCRWGICQIHDKPCPFDVALVLEEDFLTGVFGELEVLQRTNSQLNFPWSKSFFFYLSHCSHVDSISTFRILND